jgi:hypothetical protein
MQLLNPNPTRRPSAPIVSFLFLVSLVCSREVVFAQSKKDHNSPIEERDNESLREFMSGAGYLGFNVFRDDHGKWKRQRPDDNDHCFLVWADSKGGLNFSARPDRVEFATDEDVFDNNVLRVGSDGKVLIGNPSEISTRPSGYKLFVGGGILTEKIRVAVSTTSSWSDFVFDASYRLMPVSELQEYIIDNGRLPDVPSAEEMVDKGLDVAEMDAKLLQKIEELTLYMLQQQKEIEELKMILDQKK